MAKNNRDNKKDFKEMLAIVEGWGPGLFLQWSMEVVGIALNRAGDRLEKIEEKTGRDSPESDEEMSRVEEIGHILDIYKDAVKTKHKNILLFAKKD